jgi:uncharacterized protein (DUF736 family)
MTTNCIKFTSEDIETAKGIGSISTLTFDLDITVEPVASSNPMAPMHRVLELCMNLGDALHQAARFSVSSVASTPSLNLVPSMTFGNWFLPLRRSHFFDAA